MKDFKTYAKIKYKKWIGTSLTKCWPYKNKYKELKVIYYLDSNYACLI